MGTLLDLIAQHVTVEAGDANIRILLALRALLDRRLDVLGFCWDKGRFEYDERFRGEVYKVLNREHPRTFEVLETSEFR